MKQPVLIDLVISDVGLHNGIAKGSYTPYGSVPLVNNEDGFPAIVSFNYISVV